MGMAHSGTALGMLDGPEGVILVFVLSGFGSACCVGTLPIGLMSVLGSGELS